MATSFSGGRSHSTPERTTDHGQATGKLYHLRLRVEYTLFVIYKARREPTEYEITLNYEFISKNSQNIIKNY
jgi:hypothetical protein